MIAGAKGQVNYCGHHYKAVVEHAVVYYAVVRFRIASGAVRVKRVKLITPGSLAAGRQGFAPDPREEL